MDPSNTIVASAPGKLFLWGEYAVLEGAPAVVVATPERVRVRVFDHGATGVVVAAPDVGVQRWDWTTEALRRPPSADEPEALALVRAVLGVVSRHRSIDRLVIEIDSSAFVGAHGKRGMGSSAAVATALTAALLARAAPSEAAVRGGDVVFTEALAAHREFQAGRGSGADVAASCYGGVGVYRFGANQPWEPLAWPTDLKVSRLETRTAQDTRSSLNTLSQARARDPVTYQHVMSTLGGLAEQMVLACERLASVPPREVRARIPTLFDLVRDYADQLVALGDWAELPILTAEHRAIAARVAALGGVYKTSGAGGGDCGVALWLNQIECGDAVPVDSSGVVVSR